MVSHYARWFFGEGVLGNPIIVLRPDAKVEIRGQRTGDRTLKAS
jgi:hypothetical protein